MVTCRIKKNKQLGEWMLETRQVKIEMSYEYKADIRIQI